VPQYADTDVHDGAGNTIPEKIKKVESRTNSL
jgi:hypothetical protein